jgi:hypothetical protein
MSDLASYLVDNEPRKDLTLVQIVELYKAWYISLAMAKDLAHRHAGEQYHAVTWQSLRRYRQVR